MCDAKTSLPFLMTEFLPFCCIFIYYVLMGIIIVKIAKSHFAIKKIQNELQSKINNSVKAL